MQGELSQSVFAGAHLERASVAAEWRELGRGAWVIFAKHMRKFAGNNMDVGGAKTRRAFICCGVVAMLPVPKINRSCKQTS